MAKSQERGTKRCLFWFCWFVSFNLKRFLCQGEHLTQAVDRLEASVVLTAARRSMNALLSDQAFYVGPPSLTEQLCQPYIYNCSPWDGCTFFWFSKLSTCLSTFFMYLQAAHSKPCILSYRLGILITVWPWANYLNSFHVHFFICTQVCCAS